MKEFIIEILHKYSFNIESIAGHHLIVVDDDDWGEIADKINQRHEKAMKQRAWEAWKLMSPFDSETNRVRFNKWYNEK